jgi:hypothetical protein
LIDHFNESKNTHAVLPRELQLLKDNFESQSAKLDQLQEEHEKFEVKLKSDSVRNLNKKLTTRDSKK